LKKHLLCQKSKEAVGGAAVRLITSSFFQMQTDFQIKISMVANEETREFDCKDTQSRQFQQLLCFEINRNLFSAETLLENRS
jgi:hypothetical protein